MDSAVSLLLYSTDWLLITISLGLWLSVKKQNRGNKYVCIIIVTKVQYTMYMYLPQS